MYLFTFIHSNYFLKTLIQPFHIALNQNSICMPTILFTVVIILRRHHNWSAPFYLSVWGGGPGIKFKKSFPKKSYSAENASISPLPIFIRYKNTIAYTNTLPIAIPYLNTLPNTLISCPKPENRPQPIRIEHEKP